jgi:hypothetical protein
MEPDSEPQLVSFEAKFEPAPPGTPASPRPPGRPRQLDPVPEGVLTSPDPTGADGAFAQELAERVREYVRGRTGGLSAEEIAALVQQLLAGRPA